MRCRGAGRSHVGLHLPAARGRLGVCPHVCPRVPRGCQRSSPRAVPVPVPVPRARASRCRRIPTSAAALPSGPSAAGRAGRSPGAAAARGLPCSSVRCCSLHSVQGNQTVWIFWSFIVKLFPNSNSFKCHHANGKEKPFMQLQSVFLRCYAFCWVTESEFTVH